LKKEGKKKKAAKELEKFPPQIRKRILKKLKFYSLTEKIFIEIAKNPLMGSF
jgi:mRNA-degrading endonuclease RelE of RelBE toxin-antitoxin system